MSAWTTRELIAFLDRLESIVYSLSYFELLDLTPDAESGDIREAFYRKALALHPDLYRQRLSAEDHERLTAVYARIAEAYLVLRDPVSRRAYESSLMASPEAAEVPVPVPDAEANLPPKAQRVYARARAALRMGDRAGALLNLRMAAALAPHSELIRDALRELEGAAYREPEKVRIPRR